MRYLEESYRNISVNSCSITKYALKIALYISATGTERDVDTNQRDLSNLILHYYYFRVITKDTVSPEFGRLLRRIFTESREIPEIDQLGAIYERLKIATKALEETIKQLNVTNDQTITAVFSELDKLGHQIINILPETGRLLMVLVSAVQN
jgi:hypothetical protein